MSRIRSWLLTVAVVCITLLVAGCGSGGNVPVKGIVTFDGKPLAQAFVMLHSQEPKGKDAHGSTNASGAFELTALPGLYKVTVQYSEPIELSSKLKTPDEVKKALLEAYASRKPSVVIPTIYTQVAKTPLQHRVPEDGDLKVDLPRAPP